MTSRTGVIAFDLDDTLLATYERVLAKSMRTAELLGLPEPTEPAVRAAYTAGDLAAALRRWFPSVAAEMAVAAYDSLQPLFPDVPMPGVGELFTTLDSQGWIAGVLTNTPRRKLDRKLGALPPVHLSFALAAEDLAAPKPAPQCFDRLLASQRITAADLTYVGDASGDRAAACAAGVRFIRVRRRWQVWPEESGAAAVDDLRELAALLASAPGAAR